MKIQPFLIEGRKLINYEEGGYKSVVFHCSHDEIQEDKIYQIFAQTQGDHENVPESFELHVYGLKIASDYIIAIEEKLNDYWAKDKKGSLSNLPVMKQTGLELLKPKHNYTIRFLVPKEAVKESNIYKVWFLEQPSGDSSYLRTVYMYESVPPDTLELQESYDKYMAPMDFQV